MVQKRCKNPAGREEVSNSHMVEQGSSSGPKTCLVVSVFITLKYTLHLPVAGAREICNFFSRYTMDELPRRRVPDRRRIKPPLAVVALRHQFITASTRTTNTGCISRRCRRRGWLGSRKTVFCGLVPARRGPARRSERRRDSWSFAVMGCRRLSGRWIAMSG